MSVRNPTFLVKSRHGIYYFQLRIPKQFSKLKTGCVLFRRSLRTRDKREALGLARKWWVKMKENDFKWETGTQENAELYHVGKILYQKLNELDPDDSIEFDDFMMPLSLFEEKALKYYNELHSSTNNKKRENDQQTKSISPDVSNAPLLSELLDKFITEKDINWSEKNKNTNGKKDYIPKITLFINIVGNIASNHLTISTVSSYKDAMLKFPNNVNKRPEYKDKSISEVLLMDIPTNHRLSKTTIQNYFNKIATFLKWANRNGYMEEGLSSPFHRVITKGKKESEDRDAFTVNDLNSLFINDYYIKGLFKEPSKYWIPLLALFTGARQNELCQLYLDDIVYNDETWCLDFNDKLDKRLKSAAAKRIIPIHSQLINDLDFIKFIDSQREKGHIRLFPELVLRESGYGRDFSSWYNRTYRKNCQVGQENDESKVFHSFRHTLADYFKQFTNVDENKVAEIIGHTTNEGITNRRYAKSLSIQSKKDTVEKFMPPIDLSKIRKWNNN